MTGQHDDGHEGIGVGARLADFLRQRGPVEGRHFPVAQDDVGQVVGESLEPGGAVLGLVDLACAEAMQQRADNAPHMGVVIDDEEPQAIEIDANHGDPIGRASARPTPTTLVFPR